MTRTRQTLESEAEFLIELDRETIENRYALPLVYPRQVFHVKRNIYLGDTLLQRTPDWTRVGRIKRKT